MAAIASRLAEFAYRRLCACRAKADGFEPPFCSLSGILICSLFRLIRSLSLYGSSRPAGLCILRARITLLAFF